MTLVRNAGEVLKALSDLPDKPVIALQPITIHFPVRFRDIDLAQVGASSFVYGLFMMKLDNGNYAICNVNALIELGPAAVEVVQVDDEPYYNFRYEKGDVVMRTKDLVCRSELIFKAIEEFFFKGKMPWYVDYLQDAGKLFDTAAKHARTSATILPSVVEFMAAYIGRSASDRTKFIREVAKTPSEFNQSKIAWVPMRSVYWSAPGTVNKLAGAYFSDGVVSALVNPSDRTEKIERILRA